MNENITLRGCQADCLSCIGLHRERGKSKGLVVMASSLGKTITAAYDIENYIEQGGRVLYLCHNADILENAAAEFVRVLNSGVSVGYFTGSKKTKERTDILFATFQSLVKHLGKFKKDEFAYILVDEAHHAQARTYRAVLDYFEPEFLLGMTATPNRTDGRKLEEIFGEVVYYKDFIDATFDEEMLLVPTKYHLIFDDIEKIKDYLDDNNIKISISELNRRVFVPKRDEEIVRIIQEKTAKDSKKIIFCKSIEHANDIAALIDGATVVHSYINAKECSERLWAFKRGDYNTIVSVDKLNEGIDIPSVDVIVFLRSTCSQIVFYQQLGRGLRRYEGKDHVLVLDFVANCEHLEIIEDLEGRIRRAEEEARKHSRMVPDRINIDIDTPEFKDRAVDIYALIKKARIANGVYSEEELIKFLQNKAEQIGRVPSIKDINDDPNMPCDETFAKRFGSWNKALMKAGLKPNHIIKYYTKEELIKLLLDKAERDGKIPTAKDVEADPDMPSALTYQNKFGSWNEALAEAGLEHNRISAYSEEELIGLLQDKAERDGKVPSSADVKNDPNMPSSVTYTDKFGPWNEVLLRAGLEPYDVPSYSNEELTRLLQDKVKHDGKIPTTSEVDKDPNMPNVTLYRKRFGSWGDALTEAGYEPNYSLPFSDDELIKFLQDKAKRDGKTPTCRDVDDDLNMPCASTYINRFGSWKKTLRKAGLLPTKKKRTSKKKK